MRKAKQKGVRQGRRQVVASMRSNVNPKLDAMALHYITLEIF